MKFCEDIFPNKSQDLGVLFTSNFSKLKALKYLHDKNYNLLEAKFTLLYPVIFKFADYTGIEIDFSDQEKQEILKRYENGDVENSKEIRVRVIFDQLRKVD